MISTSAFFAINSFCENYLKETIVRGIQCSLIDIQILNILSSTVITHKTDFITILMTCDPNRTFTGRWLKNPLNRAHCPVRRLKDDGSGYQFVHLSTSNYEMAREVDMNLAEVDMDNFNTQDLNSQTFRLAYSSPMNSESLLRVCGNSDDPDCILFNSMLCNLDR